MVTRGRRPSVIGRTAQTVARTAVIAGTATAVSGMVAGRQGAGQAPDATPPAGGSATPASAGMNDSAIEQLKKLAELRASGVLTEEEFNAQKARLLA